MVDEFVFLTDSPLHIALHLSRGGESIVECYILLPYIEKFCGIIVFGKFSCGTYVIVVFNSNIDHRRHLKSGVPPLEFRSTPNFLIESFAYDVLHNSKTDSCFPHLAKKKTERERERAHADLFKTVIPSKTDFPSLTCGPLAQILKLVLN